VLLLPSGGCKWSDQLTVNKWMHCKEGCGQMCYMEPALSSGEWFGSRGNLAGVIQYELMGKSGIH